MVDNNSVMMAILEINNAIEGQVQLLPLCGVQKKY